jgi:hypothetical protein
MSHILGRFFLGLGAAIIFVFSVTLAYSMFVSIAPSDMPWFPWAAMGLTEFGLLCWLAGFMFTRHDEAAKVIALVMIFACLVTVGLTDAMELAHLFHVSPLFASIYYYVLIVMLCAHILAFITDLFVMYFSRPGNSFWGGGNKNGNLISPSISPSISQFPAQFPTGNQFPAQFPAFVPAVSVKELKQQHEYITAQLQAIEGDGSDPLAMRRLPRRSSSTAVQLANEQQVATLDAPGGKRISAGLNTLLTNVRERIKSGKRAGLVHGETSETTSGSTSESESRPGEGEASMTDLDVWKLAYDRLPDEVRGVETFPDFVRRMKGMDTQPDDDEEVEEGSDVVENDED